MNAKALKKHVARMVKAHREQLGISQAELGKLVGLSETTISRIERAAYLPTLEKTFNLSKALKIHPIVLLQRDSLSSFLEELPKDLKLELQAALTKLLSGSKPKIK